MEALEKAEQLKNELDSLRPFDGETEARIMQKFRLDWNYHSNNLEGNSLTYGETKALILFGVTAQGKPLKDHFEIQGHNEAINWILEVVKDKTVLTEAFIRQLHTLLLKESSYKEAQTPEGKPTRRKIEVGKYKTKPNHVITATGETFYFVTPEETPAKMQELVEWFRKEKEKADVNPIILAALFHYRFIRIHPFDDGNGRVARILMNFILMQFGYPPAIIKTEDKENYYAVLTLADADELEPFIEYVTQNLIRSLKIMIQGAKGENIEEPEDLDKELALLEGRLKKYGNKIIKKNTEVLSNFYENSIEPFLVKLLELYQKFEKLYVETFTFIGVSYKYKLAEGKERETLTEIKFIEDLQSKILDIADRDFTIIISKRFRKINRPELLDYEYESLLNIRFEELNCDIFEGGGSVVNYHESKKYSEEISSTESQKILNKIATAHKEFIEEKITDVEK